MHAHHTEVLPAWAAGRTAVERPAVANHTVEGSEAGIAARMLEQEVDRRRKVLAVHTGAAVHIADKTFYAMINANECENGRARPEFDRSSRSRHGSRAFLRVIALKRSNKSDEEFNQSISILRIF